MGYFFFTNPIRSTILFNYVCILVKFLKMSAEFNYNTKENINVQGKVRVTDLISRLNEEKKIEKKRNLALGVAAFSAVTVFGIILTI